VIKNDVRVLDGLTLTIRAGEHTAILGPNGAGKTALISLLTYDHYPLARSDGPPPVQVFGADRWEVSTLRSQLGVVSEDLQREFVRGHSAGRIRGIAAVLSGFFATKGYLTYVTVTPAMRQQAVEALARLGAGHLADRFLDEMSTGEVRRVMIARALVARPRALVLDEPAAGLDLVARQHFLELVRGIARQGTTLIFITHHVEEIIPEIRRVLLLKRGRILGAGDKETLLTSSRLSQLFDESVSVENRDGYYFARLAEVETS
jgi:iron complex transport system ATP-binding protein